MIPDLQFILYRCNAIFVIFQSRQPHILPSFPLLQINSDLLVSFLLNLAKAFEVPNGASGSQKIQFLDQLLIGMIMIATHSLMVLNKSFFARVFAG